MSSLYASTTKKQVIPLFFRNESETPKKAGDKKRLEYTKAASGS